MLEGLVPWLACVFQRESPAGSTGAKLGLASSTRLRCAELALFSRSEALLAR